MMRFALVCFLRDFFRFKRYAKQNGATLMLRDIYPCFSDRTETTSFDRHYVYHTSWAARILADTSPELHIDISSDIRFATIVSAFVPVRYYDYRPVRLTLSNLFSGHADILDLPFETGSVGSLSCMHVVEHIGLGRYGEPLDYNGDLKAIAELKRVLRKGGTLLFVVPVGRRKIRFNAHRVYSYEQIVSGFSGLTLKEFSLIPDSHSYGLIYNASPKEADSQEYGCGCFWFIG
jgi:SAM-dependent methyltransferase